MAERFSVVERTIPANIPSPGKEAGLDSKYTLYFDRTSARLMAKDSNDALFYVNANVGTGAISLVPVLG